MPASTKTAIFAPGGYVVKESDHFVEVYHGLQDIPKEHKVFSFPKLSIREQMAAYQEIIDGSSLEGYRQMQKKRPWGSVMALRDKLSQGRRRCN